MTVELVAEAVGSGARKARAYTEVRTKLHTLKRWAQGGLVKTDDRPEAESATPLNQSLG